MKENIRKISTSIINKIDKRSLVSIIILIALSCVLAFFMEGIHRDSLKEALKWILNNKTQFIFNFILVLSVTSMISSLIGCVYIGFSISSFILVFLSYVNLYKLRFRGNPLFPWDLLLNSEAGDIAGLLTDKLEIITLILIFTGIVCIAALRFILPKLNIKLLYRVPILLVAVLAIYVLGFNYDFLGQNVYVKADIKKIVWDQNESYKNNGFILSFSMNLKDAIIDEPEGYSKENIREISENRDLNNSGDNNKHNETNPNIIIIMNEAFWDPTVMENLEFSEDPLPTFKNIHENYTSGWMRIPVFGGGTSNVEFEVLTGNSMNYLPPGSMAFQQYMNNPTMSLASILKKQGYKSIGMHSYTGWFWNRIESYKNMGFDEFISMEYFEDLSKDGFFISDNVVSDMIIDEIEESEEPLFLYGVTMGNHGPYNDKRYGEGGNTIKVDGNLTEESKLIIETYSQGIKNADEALNNLVETLGKSSEPTIVVFYGDHLPMLGVNFKVYKEVGYINSSSSGKWSSEERLNMHKVPFIVWNNYGLDKDNPGIMNSSFLGAYILDYTNRDMPKYFDYLRKVTKEIPVISKAYGMDKEGEFISTEEDLYRDTNNEYRLMQYDNFFGKDYLEGKDGWIYKENPNYNKEINNINIENIEIDNDRLIIKGKNFVPSAKLLIGKEDTEYEFIDSRTISVDYKESYKDSNIKLILKMETKDVVLTESNIYNMKENEMD